MKKIAIALLAAAALTGCAQIHPGMCATSLDGVCLGRYDSNMKVVAVGSVDMRYSGIVCSSGGKDASVCSGSVNTTVESWE